MDSTDMDALRIDFVSREEFEALQEKLRVMTLKRNVAVFCCKELNTNIQGTTAEGTAEANITARYVVKRKTFVASPKNSICSLCVGDKRISPKDWFKHCQRYHPEFVVNDGYLLGRSDEVMTFCESFFAKLGLSNCHSSIIAKLLLFVDQYGNLKHGLKNLDSIALKLAADEYIFGDLQITKINEKIFSVDGIGYLGPIIASDCVNKICELASDFTYGVCFLKNTDIWNTVYFAKLISQKGYLGIIFDGSFLCVCFEEIAIKIPNSKLGTIFNDLLDFLGLTDVYYHAQGYCLIAKFVSAGNSNIKERIFRLCSGNVFPMFNKNELAYEECYAFIEGRIVYSKELYKKLVRLSRVMRIQCFPVQLAETNK